MDLWTGLFVFLALSALIAGGFAVFHRDVFKAAIAMVVNFIAVAGMYLFMGAELLAVIQLLVYAGAIAVVIIFAIMHSPLQIRQISYSANASDYWPAHITPAVLSLAATLTVLLATVAAIISDLQNIPLKTGSFSLADFARVLFDVWSGNGYYVIAFELAGILILVAIIAVVFLALPKSNRRSNPQSGKGES